MALLVRLRKQGKSKPPGKKIINEDDYYPSSDGEPMSETDLHGEVTWDIKAMLLHFFAHQNDVYVAGNNFLYWERGDRRKVVSPDTYVVFGVEKRLRDTYLAWREGGKLPDVVFEITSNKTKHIDTGRKFTLYEQVLRVPEYYLFDPTAAYISTRLRGYRLQKGRYRPLPLINNTMHSELLKLDLVVAGDHLRLFDPARDAFLTLPMDALSRIEGETERADLATQRAEEAALRAEEAMRRAEAEAKARAEAEAEIARLRAELERRNA